MDKKIIFTPVTMHGSQAGMKTKTKGAYGRLRFTPVLPEGLASAGYYLRKHIRFTPAISGLEDRGKIEKEGNSFTLDWWTKTAMFNYDALMISTFYGLEKSNFREYYNIPRKNFLLFADSGGFQIFSQKIKIEPLYVLKWQERNVDVGLTLDVPPLDASQNVVGDFDTFKRAAEQSKRNYLIAHRNWNEKLELLKVIHGSSPSRLDYWKKTVEDLEFSGYAFSPKPVCAETVAIVLAYAKEIGAKKIHIFLGSGEVVTPIMIYARKFFDRLTFDSSSFSSAGARYRRYYLPYKISRGISFGGGYNGKIKNLPCSCPVCQLATVKDMNAEGSLPGGLIALHNLYVYLQYYHFLTNLSDDEELYKAFLNDRGLKTTVRMLDFLDYSAEVGFYDAYNTVFEKEKTTSYTNFFGSKENGSQ